LDLNAGGTPVAVNGLSGIATNLGTPAFAPAGNKVVFNPMASGSISNPTRKLVVVDFDPTTNTFSNPVEVVDSSSQPAEVRPGWGAFFPDGSAVVYQQQIAAGADG